MIKTNHKLGEYLSEDGERWGKPVVDVLSLDGKPISNNKYLDLDNIIMDIMTEKLNDHYEGDFIEMVRREVREHEVEFAIALRKDWRTNNYDTLVVLDNGEPTPEQTVTPKYMGKPTEVTTSVRVSYGCRVDRYDDSFTWNKVIDRTVSNLMKQHFTYCFKKNKSIVPKDMTWETYQKTNTRVMNIPHSRKLAQEMLKKRKDEFRELFYQYLSTLPRGLQKPYAECRVQYVLASTKSDKYWQSNQLIKALGEERMLSITDEEMGEVCRKFCMDIINTMQLNMASVRFERTR